MTSFDQWTAWNILFAYFQLVKEHHIDLAQIRKTSSSIKEITQK